MRTGSNAAESAKAGKGGDGLRIREDLPRLIAQGHESLTAAEKNLLKWVGVFFRKPTPDRFMMRVRMPNGFTDSRQLRAVADLSRRLGDCVVDITTRQQIQLRGVDLHSLQTGMDNVRNINGSPLVGLTINELFDASLGWQGASHNRAKRHTAQRAGGARCRLAGGRPAATNGDMTSLPPGSTTPGAAA